MKRSWNVGSTAIAGIALCAGIGAQAPNGPGSNSQRETIKVVGCLQQSGSLPPASAPVGTAGTTGTPAASLRGFVLLNARTDMGAAVTTSPDPGRSSGITTGAAVKQPATGAESLKPNAPQSPSGAASALNAPGGGMYYLEGPHEQLRQNVNRQVEITGMVATQTGPAPAPNAPAPPPADAPPTAAATDTAAPAPRAGTNAGGLLSSGATAATGTAAAPSPAPPAAPAPKEMAGARLDVQSIRVIAPNCAPR